MKELYDKALEASDYIKSKVDKIPEIAIVLGSGLGTFGKTIVPTNTIDYAEIPNFQTTTVAGHDGKMIFGKVGSKEIVAMQGRFHRYEGYSFEDVTFYIRVFSLLGIKTLILTNAVGAINTSFAPSDLVLINDHISVFCRSPLIGKNDERFGKRFPSMSEAYDKELLKIAKKSANEVGIDLKDGVYMYVQGPMFETPAEIRMFRNMGADVVGMSTVPETIVAVHSGIKVLCVSCVTNMAAGILDKPITHSEVIETGKAVEAKFKILIDKIIENL